jgi:hypothetical protein
LLTHLFSEEIIIVATVQESDSISFDFPPQNPVLLYMHVSSIFRELGPLAGSEGTAGYYLDLFAESLFESSILSCQLV